MNKSMIVVAHTKEAFMQAVEKTLAKGYLPTEEYAVEGEYYIGKFTLDKDSESSISTEAAMKAIEQPSIVVNRQPTVHSTRKRKA